MPYWNNLPDLPIPTLNILFILVTVSVCLFTLSSFFSDLKRVLHIGRWFVTSISLLFIFIFYFAFLTLLSSHLIYDIRGLASSQSQFLRSASFKLHSFMCDEYLYMNVICFCSFGHWWEILFISPPVLLSCKSCVNRSNIFQLDMLMLRAVLFILFLPSTPCLELSHR